MFEFPERFVIASRESQLALWQSEFVRTRLLEIYDNCVVSVLGMTTQGDQILDRNLATVGGKGLFIKELEMALMDGRADIAVHSLKDVPTELPEGYCLAALLAREHPLDAFVSNQYAHFDALPTGAVVATSSIRRVAQLRTKRPDLKFVDVRGNVISRLAKLDAGQFDAMILAAAGLTRLDLTARIRHVLDPAISLPAVGQGALAIECLEHRTDIMNWLAPLSDPATTACVLAERTMSHRLGGSCSVPIAGFADILSDGQLRLRGRVVTPDGTQLIEAEAMGALLNPATVGHEVADLLLAQGADRVLAALGATLSPC